MSYLWSFQSFDAMKLSALFANERGPAADRLRTLVRSDSDEFGFDDPDEAAAVADALLASGFSYEGLDRRQARVADEVVALLFLPEGFAPELDVVNLSEEGVHHGDLRELIARNPDARMLQMLVRSGRRAGQDEPVQCEYCILDPTEVASLIDEVRTAIAQPIQWSDEWRKSNSEDFLLSPLLAAGDRWVFGSLG
jgi:hypothetical protein